MSSNNYQNADLSGSLCSGSTFTGGQENAFRGANLSNAVFDRSRFVVGRHGFEFANLTNASMARTSVTGQSLTFRGTDLTNVDLSDAVIDIFGNAPFYGASLRDANLSRARFNFTWGSASVFDGADFTGANAIGVMIEGESLGFFSAKLLGSNFSNASIQFDNSTFAHADLTDANFSGATIIVTSGKAFDRANLIGANFSQAVISPGLRGFEDANLTNANFSDATINSLLGLRGTNLTKANFTGATLTSPLGLRGAVLNDTVFSSADLSLAQLDQVMFSTLSPPKYNLETLFPVGFDPVASNWELVPEPQSLLLALLGSMGLTRCRSLLR